ncbi:Asp-tRNA(Asn)/Glu-tRNA(Gln) amidotransferase subunit GatA [Candidatus Eisenbacteria bacterium]|uniref:Glutamyl-tRNA(Gln) amidotransferase subunit A n=1 Tax=Eiseniibacteriota bacterium TaxID=2212470 RepID=A0ABV6YJ92_UNCEI
MAAPPTTIEDFTSAIRSRGLEIPQAIDSSLRRISKQDKRIRAFLHVMPEYAQARAEELQKRVDVGEWPGPLTGVPVAIKDNILCRDVPATAGSRILEGFRPIYTATAVSRLLDAGAIPIGKANMDEFGMGSSNEFSAFYPARNPYDLNCVPGGSSGGSAAALAGGFVLGALGSDTGGSVRQPAAFCGLVALKPQYGSVSRYGLIAFGSSLDQIGPMARTARDCAVLYNAVCGHDPRDSNSLPNTAPIRVEQIDAGVRNTRLGIPSVWLRDGLDPDVRSSFKECCERFRSIGAEIVDVELPNPQLSVSAYYILANAEASSNLARYDGVRYGLRDSESIDIRALYRNTRGRGFGPEVKRRILLGTHVLSAGYYEAYYQKALMVRRQVRQAFDDVFASVDAILMPTTPTPAFRLGEKLDDPLSMYLCDLFTTAANLTGYPAASFPIGLSGNGLPVGAQLCGPAYSEGTLLGLVHRFTQGVPLPLPDIANAPVEEGKSRD